MPVVRRAWLVIWRFVRGRRWYQFSLRSLLVVTLILGAAGGWLGKRLVQKHEERQAIEAIVTAGGDTSFEQSGPRWLRIILGDNFFSEVHRVDVISGNDAVLAQLPALRDVEVLNINGSAITGPALVQCLDHLKELPRLRTLCFGGPHGGMMSFGDSDLERIKDLTELESLGFWDASITDDGFKNFERMTQLKLLMVENAPITGAGLINLKRLTRLERLDLIGTNFNDAGLVYAKDMVELRQLWLARTKVTDAGLNNLRRLSHLENLLLNNTLVSDAGLVNLKNLPCLWMLQLSGTKVSDAGLADLRNLKQLKLLQVDGTSVTARAVNELRKSLPECKVWFGPSASPISVGKGFGDVR